MENLQKVENSLQNIELENAVNIDWLSLNFKNIQAEELLEIFCNATNDTNVSFENFVYNDDRGFVTGYTHSYSYLGTPYIVISFCPGRSEMGVNIQITGQGCKLIYFDDLIRFLEETSKITDDYKCNRLDIAFDDFNRIIPVKEMIESTIKDLDVCSGVRNIISRIKRDMISIYTNHWNGYTSENLVFGKHRSARSFRLYDKKLEQKRSDIDYWYRLEIELRTKGKSKNADIAFKQFINGEKTIYDLFYYNISTIVIFTKDYKSSNTDFTTQKMASFWIDFLDYLTSHNTYYAKLDV